MKVMNMSFEELRRLVNDGKKLKEFVMRESAEKGWTPPEVLLLVIMIYRKKAREIAVRN